MEVTIDGKKLTLDAPVTVLEAAGLAGVKIPTLCWHPRVSVLGACRLCMIEVEGINRLLAACTTQVSDGMSVLTDTPLLRKVRQTMLELLLCRHPLDCPTCVKGGECELQELTYNYAAPENRFPENPAPYPVSDPSPFVERDSRKCVLCRRCVRVCREVRGVTVLAAMERGYHKTVGTFFQQDLKKDFQEPYNCEFCGACIDICPVGALNSKMKKFRARTWEGSATPSVCPFCSVGCLLTLQVKEGELVRTVPLEGPNNQDQACFRGRFGTDYVNVSSRMAGPVVFRDGKQIPVEHDEAVRFVADKIRSAGRTEALVSSSLTQEEVRAACSFMENLVPDGTVRIVDTLGMEEEGGYRSFGGRSWEDLDEADLIFVAGQDFTVFEPVAGVRIRVSRRSSGAGLVVLDGRDTLLGGEADLSARPVGAGLPLLLGSLLGALGASHPGRLKGAVDKNIAQSLPGGDPAEVEKKLGLAEGTVSSLAALLAQNEKIVFLGHRGWYDPSGYVPLLLAELDRLLSGSESRGIVYLGRDCNSRGASAYVSPSPPSEEGPDLMLLFGTDILKDGLPASNLVARASGASSLIAFDTFFTATVRKAAAAFPLPHFGEKDGTFVASNGLEQKLTRAMTPPAGVAPLWDVLDEVSEALGKSLSFSPAPGAEGEEVKTPSPAAGGKIESPASLPAGPDEKCILLRGIPVADSRLRLVDETVPFLPGKVVEVNPADAAALGIPEGGQVQVISGKARLTAAMRSDLKTPRGQVHIPFDPADEEMVSFAGTAERPEGWSADCRRLTALERVSQGTEG